MTKCLKKVEFSNINFCLVLSLTHNKCNAHSLVDATDHLFKISVAINIARLMKAKVIDNYIKQYDYKSLKTSVPPLQVILNI